MISDSQTHTCIACHSDIIQYEPIGIAPHCIVWQLIEDGRPH